MPEERTIKVCKDQLCERLSDGSLEHSLSQVSTGDWKAKLVEKLLMNFDNQKRQ